MPRMRAVRFSAVALFSFLALTNVTAQQRCESIVRADVIAFDWAYQINRLGTTRTNGEIYALREDVMSSVPGDPRLRPGKIMLRPDKRPRPIVLRVNAGGCLEIKFANLLTPKPSDPMQPVTRTASIHVSGMQMIDSIADDGTWVGQNPLIGKGHLSGILAPNTSTTYRLYAQEEGTNLLYSTAAQYNNFNPMQISTGLFGAVNVEPRSSEWYRSQVSEEDLRLATIGTLPDGHPQIDYNKPYPAGHPRAGKPILRMIDSDGNIVHSDLTAVITGPDHGLLPGGPGDNPMYPDRNLPFREVTIAYHESQDVVQPFPYFMYANNSQVPRNDAGADTFGINFGIAGIAPTILANRIGVGPAHDCPECKFEEFFLSSWPIGDPSIVVDVPANTPCTTAQLLDLTLKLEANPRTFNPEKDPCTPDGGKKATKAFFPDDPSNVYHSYLGDHVRFRVLHGGAAVHHIHHHHAHQWLRTPESSQSNYLDAQAVGPGSSFTAELVFAGSGNRNLTTGDSIFHCHFYPHFASGMWALYRVHDVFEAGTELDAGGIPKEGARALPDGEIERGTPIPAIVPLPLMAMAPMPAKVEIVKGQAHVIGDGHPGYPFFIPGEAGHRAPHPPMDFAVEPKTGEVLDGGLPRHLVKDATVVNEQHTTLDWSKDLGTMDAYQLPEDGTPGEKRAIAFFSQPTHASYTPEGKPGLFRVNGLPRGPQPGAPFSDPAVVDGKAVGNPKKIYRGVDLQLNAVFNKAGWHYPQQRILALWGDVKDYVDGIKPPEPLFVRATNDDVIEYWHTNLVPAYFELDDFEVRTPTDILGQHIHLVKFDVMTSDGAANGFNYEDGTYSPEEVQERIHSINLFGGLLDLKGNRVPLKAKSIQEFGDGPTKGSKAWVGAQATVQRWWLDPLMDLQPNQKVKESDRTYMTVFTHDHFGPSTHQMIGLYGGVLIEPPNTKWTSLDGKTVFGTRYDGGPTSYAANIIFNAPELRGQSYREFGLEWGDTQHGYTQSSRHRPDCYRYTRPDGTVYEQGPPDFDCVPLAPGQQYYGWADPAHVLNCINCPPQPPLSSPPGTLIPNLPGSAPWPPQPLLVTDFSVGMMSMNYRLEPLPLRVYTPPLPNPKLTDPSMAAAKAEAADLSSAFRSIERLDPAFSIQPVGGSQIDPTCRGFGCFTFPKMSISEGMGPADPYTPMLHGYEGDKVQVRLLAGAHTSMHDYTMHGMRWLAEPFDKNSGYRNTQFILLSEHYELLFDLPRIGADPSIDYLYNPSASYEGLTNGAWGLLRVWNPSNRQPFLAPLNSAGAYPTTVALNKPPSTMTTDCSKGTPCIREYEVHAMTVQQATGDPNASILYNKRGVNLLKGASDTAHPLEDPLGLVYVAVPKGEKYKPTPTVEPLVLRANAGDWIHVTLVNDFTGNETVFKTFEAASRFGLTYASPYNYIQIASSPNVGLHAQLVSYDVRSSDGATIGRNPVQTAAPGKSVDYWWYAGIIEGNRQTPVEFGSINLLPSDPLMQVYRGLFGSLIVEPAGSRWIADPHSSSSATVWAGNKVFREFVVTYQNDANMLTNGASWWATGSPLAGFNYRSEPPWLRFGKMLDGALGASKPADWTNLSQDDVNAIAALPMTLVNGTATTANQLVRAEPETPIFRAPARMPARFRLVMPGGDGDNQITWELTGHLWQEEPYMSNSTKIGYNPKSNVNGSLTGFGVTSAYEVVLDDTPGTTPSGGRFGVPGDYMYRAWTANMFQGGAWGIFRVAPWKGSGYPDTVGITNVNGQTVSGYTTPCPMSLQTICNAGGYVSSVSVAGQNAPVVNGFWTLTSNTPLGDNFTVTSPAGGVTTWGIVASPSGVEAAAIEQPMLTPQQTGPRQTRNSRP